MDLLRIFIYELCCCGFVFSCIHVNFRFQPCFKEGFPWHSSNCRVWIHSETRTWHDKNIHSNAPYRYIQTIQLNCFTSFAKLLSVCLRTKWLWVSVQLQSLKIHISLVSTKAFFNIQATIESGSPVKRLHDMTRTYSQCTVHISTNNSAQSCSQFR